MMSVPAINSLPPSGNQSTKMNSSTTANSSVTSIGLSVSPKLSVIPSPQIPATQAKSPTGVNLSTIPLSLVFENKVSGSQQSQLTTISKSPIDKPKDLSPAKPTSNGVEPSSSKLSPQSQSAQPVLPPPVISANNKLEETPVLQASNTNHSEKKINAAEENHEPTISKEESTHKTSPSSTNNKIMDNKVEQSLSQVFCSQEEKADSKKNNETADVNLSSSKENLTVESKTQELTKSPVSSQPGKRKREVKLLEKTDEEPEFKPEKKPRRIRSQVLPYQSPLPELATFISKSLKEKDATQKNNEEKLIVFYKNEFLAVRNAEGGFYLCQTLQNVYRSSHRIRIRWLSQDKDKSNEEGDIYTPDFYDLTDFECILTTVALNKTDKNMYKLQKLELERIENILKRALDVEKGVTEKPSITEEHPDGIDLSLYKDESQLQKPKKASKRTASSPLRRSPKQAKKEDSGEVEKLSKRVVNKGKRQNMKSTKKVPKTSVEKSKVKKKGTGKLESKSSKAVDHLKVSPPNEKARVVAKVLRKVDIVAVKEMAAKKLAKSKTSKRSQETLKNQKKKPLKSGTRKSSQKMGSKGESSSHNERRQTKNKNLSTKSKKN